MAQTIKSGFTLTAEFVAGSGQKRIKRGIHYARPGYAPLSGLAPNPKAAKKAALKNT